MDVIPILSEHLIADLRKTFPRLDQAGLHAMEPNKLAFYSGQQSIIELLETRLEQTNEVTHA